MKGKAGRAALTPAEPSTEVTTLELFFDLVFVLTITQLARVVHDAHSADGYLQALAILVVTWWMYDGYAWLSNNVGPADVSTRVPMLLAMCGFLVMAVATPDAFDDAAWPFAIANLFVVSIHGVQFLRSSVGDSARAILRIAPTNFTSALLVLIAAVVPDEARGYVWAAACLVLVQSIVRGEESGFDIRAEHFAERHRLLVIIALGETVVATGVSAEGKLRDEDGMVVVALLLSVTLLAELWWVYFGGDDDRGAQVLDDAPPARRARLAMLAYALGHFVHIAGLILLATGVEAVVAHPGDVLGARLAWTMSAGCATFLLAEAFFVRTLQIGTGLLLIGAAVAVLPATWLGSEISGLAELIALTLLVGVLLAVRSRQPGRRESAPVTVA
jgi:low temperature requirement protein LtrA